MTGPRQLPFDRYAADDAVNYSKLRHMIVSPLHYLEATRAPDRDTPSRRLGRITHTAVFEPHRLAVDYLVYTESKTKGEGSKTRWEAFKTANAGRCIVSADELLTARSIADAVRKHPLSGPLLAEQGMAEACLEWTDAMTGIRCKGRLDWLTMRDEVDLKTSSCAVEPRLFASEAFKLGYFHQRAFYARGARAVLGQRVRSTIIAVEPSPPYDVAVYPVHPEALQAADEHIDALLHQLAECRKTGVWPGKFAEPQTLNLPRWAYPSEQDGMDFMKEAG